MGSYQIKANITSKYRIGLKSISRHFLTAEKRAETFKDEENSVYGVYGHGKEGHCFFSISNLLFLIFQVKTKLTNQGLRLRTAIPTMAS